MRTPSPALALVSLTLLLGTLDAQRRGGIPRGGGPGTVSGVQWSADGKSVSYTSRGQTFRLDLATRKKEAVGRPERRRPGNAGRAPRRGRRGRGAGGGTGRYIGRPTRGRQYTTVESPDKQWHAIYRDWNVVLEKPGGGGTVQVTTDGNKDVHYGTASWVYGEELNERKAMWWTPDSKQLIYYRFDDTKVEPFHLVTGWTKTNTKHYPEYYPKAGAANPAAALFVYDLATRTSQRVQAGGGSEEYLYNLRASPGGKVLMVNWTDRLQQHLKVLAIDPVTGQCRTIVEERQDTWQTNSPRMQFLKDGHRFLWPTDESGFTHYELRDLDGKLHGPVTAGAFQTERVELVDEAASLVGFTAYSSPVNPYFLQYHLTGLDGTGARRVTELDFHHSNFSLSPDRRWLIAQYEAVNRPPSTALYSTADGKLVTHLAKSDPKTAANLAEMFKFRSKDDAFDIYGVLFKPKDFDPNKSYPLLNPLYAGPGRTEVSARYVSQEARECSRGYLVVKVNNRGGGKRGKAFLGAVYKKLGDVEIQDHADAIRTLRERPYVDGSRVGIVGGSYGGYMAAMGVFKHPDVYKAGVNKSGVTDWRNYDTIYTERYMSTPQLNEAGYDNGSVMTFVKNFRGHILIMHGMVDDNVHPNNAFQLIDAMDRAGKRYESRFFPNNGHGTGRGGQQSQWEFFDRILEPGR